MRAALSFCVLLLVCTGCPERPIQSRIVALSFPASLSQGTVTVSVSDTDVQEALKVIDSALISHGFTRDSNAPEAVAQGFIAGYSRRDKDGLIPLGDNPGVWLHDGRLEVVFAGGRVPISASMQASVDMLRKELSSHYGSKRVRVEHGPG